MKLFVAWVLLLSFAVAQDDPGIVGPTESDPGDLIVLDASGLDADDYVWILANSDKSYFVHPKDPSILLFSSGTPGEYIFCLSASFDDADSGSRAAGLKHVVVVGGTPPAPPEPPSPPNPPNPPEPPPGPEPLEPDLSGVAGEAYAALKTIDCDIDELKTFARNIETVRREGLANRWVLTAWQSELARLNRESLFDNDEAKNRWLSFGRWFGDQSTKWRSTGEASDDLKEIATAMNALAKYREQTATMPMRLREVDPYKKKSLRSAVDSLKRDVQELENKVW